MGCEPVGELFVIEVHENEYRINGVDTNPAALREMLLRNENRESSEIVFLVPSYEEDSILLIQGMDIATELGYGNVKISTPEIYQDVQEFKRGGDT